MSKFLDSVLDIFFPPKCIFCRKVLHGKEKDICPLCEGELPVLEGGLCSQKGDFFTKCVSALKYEGKVRESIHRFKFSGCSNYCRGYAKILAPLIKSEYSGEYDIITWVPLSEKRERERGYDQAMLLAMAVAVELDDVAVETLKKIRDVKAQSSMGGKDNRAANVLGAYEVPDKELVEGQRILVIDDVVTTGSTLSECARMLRMAGAENVVCATVARTMADLSNRKKD